MSRRERAADSHDGGTTIDPGFGDSSSVDVVPEASTRGRTSVHREARATAQVVTKRATGRDRSRLRHEADLISRIGSRRVVEVVELLEDDEHTDMVMVDAGSRCLFDLDLGTPELTLRALQRLAEAVADLHDLGWSHGAVCAEHAVVTARGTVRLCSISSARPLGAGTTADDDVAALVAVVSGVGRRPVDGLGPIESIRARTTGRHLQRLAERATVTHDRTGLGARALVSDLRAFRVRHDSEGSASLRATVERVRRASSPHIWAAGGVLACVAIGVLGLGAVRSSAAGSDHRSAASSAAGPTSAATSSTTAAPDTAAGPGDPSATSPATTPRVDEPPAEAGATATTSCVGTAVDIDGDGCDDAVTAEGEMLHLDGRTYALGVPGDIAVVGDWDCDGTATARLWRATSGEVFEFRSWATAEEDTVGELVGSIDHAVGIVRGDDPDQPGCDVLHVVDADGSQEEL